MDFTCGKRVAAWMADMLDALSRSGELFLDASIEDKLRTMPASSIDRLLKAQRRNVPEGARDNKTGQSAEEPDTDPHEH